jgi:hypothetical protein
MNLSSTPIKVIQFEKNEREKFEWRITKVQNSLLDIYWPRLASKIHKKMGYERNDFSRCDTFIYGWGLILRFKNDEDEAHFIMLANSGVL